jgi:hypothetical protein
MMFSTILVGFAAASMTSAWQILNYDNGGCSGNGRIFAGSGETDCLGIEGDVWGIRFNPQDEDLVLDFYAFDCPNGPIGDSNNGDHCTPICQEGGCFTKVKVVSSFA